MTSTAAPNANDLYASVRPVFQRVFERANAFAAQGLNANERANAFVKSLEILNLERRFFNDPTSDDWRRRVETTLDALDREISAVESRSERAYLRRLALDAALALNVNDAIFFVEPFADAALAEIDESEERQNALVAYATRLAERISRFSTSDDAQRAKAFALLEEIEDLRLFERAAGDVLAAVLFSATQRNDAPSLSSSDSATLDLKAFGDDVAETWEQFESPGGFLELCERATAERFALFCDATPTPQEIALRQALSEETRRRLETLLASLDAGLADDGAPLDAATRAELQSVVDEAVIASPFALKNGVFFRAFLERSRNLRAFVPIFERLTEAENARDGSNSTIYRNEIYRRFSLDFAEEKTRWLESARLVATRFSTFEAELRVKLNRLTTLAEIELRFGDKTNGKNSVREILGLLPRLGSLFERAQIYRRLVAAHLFASYPKAAQKLAALWKAELDAIEPDDLRDAALVEAFELYSQTANNDAASLITFAESLASPLARLEIETRSQIALHFSQADESAPAENIVNIVDASFTSLQAIEEISPDEAVFALVKIATAIAERLVGQSLNK
ncbi:MAG: hypothetical protein J6K25_06635 [Thermoguttaceae bacterium]|nr:hypothetical protein [Thermoguttaceae bacterium]